MFFLLYSYIFIQTILQRFSFQNTWIVSKSLPVQCHESVGLIRCFRSFIRNVGLQTKALQSKNQVKSDAESTQVVQAIKKHFCFLPQVRAFSRLFLFH